MQASAVKAFNFIQNKHNFNTHSYKSCLRLSPKPLWESNELLVLQTLRSQCDKDLKDSIKDFKLIQGIKPWYLDWFDPLATGIRSYRKSGVNPHLKCMNSVRRLYLCVNRGHMPLMEIHCKSSIIKKKNSNISHTLAEKLTDGYPAYSIFLPLFHTKLGSLPVTVSELLDITGVPYQARLHSIAIGYPLIGDANANNPLFKRYLFNDIGQPDHVDILHLHCWKAEFLIEKENELSKIYVHSPDLLLPMLGLCSRNESSSDSLLSNSNHNKLYLDDKSSSFIEHKGFFHHVDPSNIEGIYSKLVEPCEHTTVLCQPDPDHEILEQLKAIKDQKYQISKNQKFDIQSEMRMNFPQRIHQKFHDNHTPFDSTKS